MNLRPHSETDLKNTGGKEENKKRKRMKRRRERRQEKSLNHKGAKDAECKC